MPPGKPARDLSRDGTTTRAEISSGDAQLPGGTETILFVEDEAPVRRAAVHALRRAGYRVVEAGSGTEALIAWRRHRQEIRLLVTDVLMPGGVSGRALAERLLSEAPTLKVGFISGYDPYPLETRTPGRNRSAPMLSKPFAVPTLLAFVRQRLDS
jgi:two-component system, cell cycle sensor histidine kinase and response regulator CckA